MTAVLPSADEPAVAEAVRRRTFAVISHPDAGKSTLTEALALHARVIQEAGAIHGKAGRKSTVSDWMDMEKARGISISSAALQFGYGDAVVNLLDTPGHADFSEDTYRVLAAVDSAVMLLDAAALAPGEPVDGARVAHALIAAAVTVVVHLLAGRRTLVSIAAGTLAYVLLVNLA